VLQWNIEDGRNEVHDVFKGAVRDVNIASKVFYVQDASPVYESLVLEGASFLSSCPPDFGASVKCESRDVLEA